MLAKLFVERNPLARFLAMRMSRLIPSATALVMQVTEVMTTFQCASTMRTNLRSGSIRLSFALLHQRLRNFSAQPM